MLNPATATRPLIDGEAIPPEANSFEYSTGAGFAPLFTRASELELTMVTDELGRRLVGVFVPDGELL